MSNETNHKFQIHQGFEEPARIAGFTNQELFIGIASGMIFVIMLNGVWVFLGFVVMLVVLYIIKKNNRENSFRGVLQHAKWKIGFWNGKDSLPDFPDSNITRLDN
jgi:type IV secretory pathway VirB3-like protein